MGYVLGVDLGTTYSSAAIATADKAERFPLGNRTPTIPSVVTLRADGEVLVGEAAERRALTEPTRTAREFKRRLGDPTPLILGGTPYGAEALSAHLLRWIVDKVVEQQGDEPDAIVLSHPANWGPYKLDLLSETVRLADVGAVSFITEPEAAAVHYARRERIEPGQMVAVYDFGGGTFDAAVLRRTDDGFELVGTPEGMERIGGIDFDQAIFAHVDRSLGGAVSELAPDDTTAMAAVQRLRDECQIAKETLSQDSDVDIPVLLPTTQTEVRLTRSEFESMIRPRITETIAALERAVRSAGVTTDDIAKILLVGGSSRIPLVGQMVREATGRPIALDAHPKFAIAIGASLTGAAGVARPQSQEREVADKLGTTDGATAAAAAGVTGAAAGEPEAAVEPSAEPAPPAEPQPPAPAEVVETSSMRLDREPTVRKAPEKDKRNPMVLVGAGLGVVAAVVVGIVVFGGGGGTEPIVDDQGGQTIERSETPDDTTSPSDAASPDEELRTPPVAGLPGDRYAEITRIDVSGDAYEVTLDNYNFDPEDDAYDIRLFWNDLTAAQAQAQDAYDDVFSDDPATVMKVLDRPLPATGICARVVPDGGDLEVDPDTGEPYESGNCVQLPMPPTSGDAMPGDRFVELTGITVSGGRYVVDYTTYNFEPELNGIRDTWHLHVFWYPTYDEDVVGANVPQSERGSWLAWANRVIDNAQFDVGNRPEDATMICAVVAEFNHEIALTQDGQGYPSGTCVELPDA